MPLIHFPHTVGIHSAHWIVLMTKHHLVALAFLHTEVAGGSTGNSCRLKCKGPSLMALWASRPRAYSCIPLIWHMSTIEQILSLAKLCPSYVFKQDHWKTLYRSCDRLQPHLACVNKIRWLLTIVDGYPCQYSRQHNVEKSGEGLREVLFSSFLCCLVVRVLGYRSGGPGSIPGTTRKKSSGSGTGSSQLSEYN
jgi:hypothetical protein